MSKSLEQIISDQYNQGITMNLALYEIYMDLALLSKDYKWCEELQNWKNGRTA